MAFSFLFHWTTSSCCGMWQLYFPSSVLCVKEKNLSEVICAVQAVQGMDDLEIPIIFLLLDSLLKDALNCLISWF